MTITAEDYARLKPLLIHESRRTNRRNKSYSEDDVHDAFVALLSSNSVSNIKAWLAAVARLRAITRYNTWDRWIEPLDRSEEPLYDAGIEAAIDDERRRSLIRQLLEHLVTSHREVVMRFYFERHSKDRILADMQLQERQFVNAKNKALAKMRRAAVRRGY